MEGLAKKRDMNSDDEWVVVWVSDEVKVDGCVNGDFPHLQDYMFSFKIHQSITQFQCFQLSVLEYCIL